MSALGTCAATKKILPFDCQETSFYYESTNGPKSIHLATGLCVLRWWVPSGVTLCVPVSESCGFLMSDPKSKRCLINLLNDIRSNNMLNVNSIMDFCSDV